MSVSIQAISAALAMRAAMGEKAFNEWVESNTVRFATNFRNAKDVVQTVKLAGYDAIPWYGDYKTHIDQKLWFFWEQHEGKWKANFSKSDDMDKVRAFFRDLQHKSNRQILFVAPQQSKVAPVISKTLPTIYADRDMLLGTLQKYGAQQVQVQGLDVACRIDGIEMQFHQPVAGTTYELSFGEKDTRAVYDTIRRLDEGYRSNVQEATYENVKKQLDEKHFIIEDEEIMDDNSIVLTVSI